MTDVPNDLTHPDYFPQRSDLLTGNVELDQITLEEHEDAPSRSILKGLLSQVSIGSDLSKITLPTFILEPRSFLEKLGDFFAHPQLLVEAAKLEGVERLVAVTKWFISGFHVRPLGVKKPYNPMLGEFFHCSWPEFHSELLCEQVCHHPPVSAFVYSCETENVNIEYQGSILFKSKFSGNSASVISDGTCTLTFTNKTTGEKDEWFITYPRTYVKGVFIGTTHMQMGDECEIFSKQLGLQCNIEFKQKGIFFGQMDGVRARISTYTPKIKRGVETDERETQEKLFEVTGTWSTELSIKDAETKEEMPFFHVTEPYHEKTVIPARKMNPFESRRFWRHVTYALHHDDQEKATEEKTKLENNQRAYRAYRNENDVKHVNMFFDLVDEENHKWYWNGKTIRDIDRTENFQVNHPVDDEYIVYE
ncbi:hypothetical protein PCE1_002661 [Barthelona sp. PCE]